MIEVSSDKTAGGIMHRDRLQVATVLVLGLLTAAGNWLATSPAAQAADEPKKAGAAAIPDTERIAWGEATNSLQIGLTTLGKGAASDWFLPFVCPGCPTQFRSNLPGKCSRCSTATVSSRYTLCESCAGAKRICQSCGAAKPSSAVLIEGDPIKLELHIRNAATDEIKLREPSPAGAYWRITFSPGNDLARVAKFAPGQPVIGATAWAPVKIPASGNHCLTPCIDANWVFADVASLSAAKHVAAPLGQLPPGKYVVTATYEHARHEQDRPCPFWHGQATTGTVEIEVQAKDAAPVAGAPDEATARKLAWNWATVNGHVKTAREKHGYESKPEGIKLRDEGKRWIVYWAYVPTVWVWKDTGRIEIAWER